MQHTGQHHHHVRHRIYKKLEPVPHPEKLARLLDRAMPIVALIGPLAFIPQVIQILVLKDASDFALSTWLLWALLCLVWLMYGFVHKALPIIIGNIAYIFLYAIIIAAIFVY